MHDRPLAPQWALAEFSTALDGMPMSSNAPVRSKFAGPTQPIFKPKAVGNRIRSTCGLSNSP